MRPIGKCAGRAGLLGLAGGVWLALLFGGIGFAAGTEAEEGFPRPDWTLTPKIIRERQGPPQEESFAPQDVPPLGVMEYSVGIDGAPARLTYLFDRPGLAQIVLEFDPVRFSPERVEEVADRLKALLGAALGNKGSDYRWDLPPVAGEGPRSRATRVSLGIWENAETYAALLIVSSEEPDRWVCRWLTVNFLRKHSVNEELIRKWEERRRARPTNGSSVAPK